MLMLAAHSLNINLTFVNYTYNSSDRQMHVKSVLKNTGHTFQLLEYFSGNKFYQLVSSKDPFQESLTDPILENNILTRYLESSKDKNFQTQIKNKRGQSTSLQQSEADVLTYKKLLTTKSYGSVRQQQFKGAKLNLMGLNYDRLDEAKLYKSLFKFQPDCIIVQNKPNLLNPEFQILKKNPQNNTFSDKLYFEQLSLNKCKRLNFLNKTQVLSSLQSKYYPRKHSFHQTKQLQQQVKGLQILDHEIVRRRPLLVSSFYKNYYHDRDSSLQQCDVFLGQIPTDSHRQWICNSNSLMELQQMLKVTAKQLPLYPNLQISPYQLASLLFADQFLAINDRYMATLIEIAIALKYKRIMLLSGVAQNQMVWQVLSKGLHSDSEGQIDPLLGYLVAPKVKGSILRDFEPLELIEKHILMDVVYHGLKTANVKVSQLQTTNKIICHYKGEYPEKMLKKFRLDKTLEYCQLLGDKIQEGEKLKKKQFMRQALRL